MKIWNPVETKYQKQLSLINTNFFHNVMMNNTHPSVSQNREWIWSIWSICAFDLLAISVWTPEINQWTLKGINLKYFCLRYLNYLWADLFARFKWTAEKSNVNRSQLRCSSCFCFWISYYPDIWLSGLQMWKSYSWNLIQLWPQWWTI